MAANEDLRFSDMVESALTDREATRTLWVPLSQQFDRDGPDAVGEYLRAQRQQLVDRVKALLGRVEGRLP